MQIANGLTQATSRRLPIRCATTGTAGFAPPRRRRRVAGAGLRRRGTDGTGSDFTRATTTSGRTGGALDTLCAGKTLGRGIGNRAGRTGECTGRLRRLVASRLCLASRSGRRIAASLGGAIARSGKISPRTGHCLQSFLLRLPDATAGQRATMAAAGDEGGRQGRHPENGAGR